MTRSESSGAPRTARHMLWAGLLLAVFAAAGVSLVAVTESFTRERIAANERAYILVSLHEVVAPERHDNDLLNDTTTVSDADLLGTAAAVMVYRSSMDGAPVAAILMPVAPDGYGGPIKLLVGINYDGTLSGVRVIAHRETPGLGAEELDVARSDWLTGFAGLSLASPPSNSWGVKRDGGSFDQFTGATITPRAVVKAVHNSLLYFEQHRDELFANEAP